MKKIPLCIFFFLLMFMFNSCGKLEKDASIDSSIPLLYFTLNDEGDKIQAKPAKWNYKENKIDFVDEVQDSVLISEWKSVKISAWDGSFRTKKLFSSSAKNSSGELFGIGIHVEWLTERLDRKTYLHTYTFHLPDNKIIENISLGHPPDINEEEFGYAYQCAIAYDNGNITFVFMEPQGSEIYVAAISPDDGNCTWKTFPMSSHSGITPIYATNSILLGDYLYGTNGDNGSVKTNITDGSSVILSEVNEVGENLISFGGYDPDGPLYVLPYGAWDDKVIWKAPICTESSIEYMYCIFGQNFEGALYIDNLERWHIYNQLKEECAVIDMHSQNLFQTAEHDYIILPN